MTEADARAHCKTRDRDRCRVPSCFAVAVDLHHIEYRSQAPEKIWDTGNLVSLCRSHHSLVHSGSLEIAGNADHIIEVTGDDFDFVALACHEIGQ